jgi:hypothetical protein
MWDLIKFYDDLKHSFVKIMLACGTKVGYDAITELMVS